MTLPAGARERIAAIPMPPRIAALRRDARGYPVPRFVLWIDGKPDFRIMDLEHLARCVNQTRCWVCGEPLGRFRCFVVGPMCIINRRSAEPPSHLECGRYSAQVCPFLAIPEMRRIEAGLPDNTTQAGIGIKRNPGVVCLWSTHSYSVMRVQGGILFKMDDPNSVEWWSRGRAATRDEVCNSIDSGLPLLQKIAADEGQDAIAELENLHHRALAYLPSAEAA